MSEEIKSILRELNIDARFYEEFLNPEILNYEVNDKEEYAYIEMKNDMDISFLCYEELLTKFSSYFDEAKIELIIINENEDSLNFKTNFDKAVENIKRYPYINSVLEKIEFRKYSIYLSVLNEKTKSDLEKEFKKLTKELLKYGTHFNYKIVIDEELLKEVKKKIKEEEEKIASRPFVVQEEKPSARINRLKAKKTKDDGVIFGSLISEKEEITKIYSLTSEIDNVVIEGKIFNVEDVPRIRMLKIKITDKTDSIICKAFFKDEKDLDLVKSKCKDGSWIKVKGSTKEDAYERELVLNFKDINVSNKTDEKIEDNALVKRVELNVSTMMSQMDGLCSIDLDKHTCEIVSECINMGYKALAITDTAGCQGFPTIQKIIERHNKTVKTIKGLEEKIKEESDDERKKELSEELDDLLKKNKNREYFKGIYGTELQLVDDTIDIVIRPTDLELLATEYVVFDTETTGFNAGGEDVMIEIGAVKIKNGEITETFDMFIDLKREIPKVITDLTGITNEMVKGAKDEKEVVGLFLKFVNDLPLVAHNAKFDLSFLEMAMKRHEYGELKNTVIDTLELSRTLDQGFARHSLSAITKRYDVEFDEEDESGEGRSHHRADYDAEATAKVFHKMLLKLLNQNFKLISDINKLVSKDEIHKFGRTFTFNAIALNQEGLKNLYRMISLANTKYLYKTPRILRSEIEKLRKGLLIGSNNSRSEVFIEARSKEGQELANVINFYDYVEVQPLDVYNHLIQMGDFSNEEELKNHVIKVINSTIEAGKIIVATGDVHHFRKEDKVFREMIINQKVPGGGRHYLARDNITYIPSTHFRTTEEMLNDFSFLDRDLAYQLVVENTNKIADMVEQIVIIPDTKGIPFSPRVKNDDGEYLDCAKMITDIVYERATKLYSSPLPHNIEERISTELYGDVVYKMYKDIVGKELDGKSENEIKDEIFKRLHNTLIKGFEGVKKELGDYFKKGDSSLTEKEVEEKIAKELGGIIGGGFDSIYIIAERLVKNSTDQGYIVGSRGSVGSSFVANLLHITEVNPLPPHYRCPKCGHSVFEDKDGNSLGATYLSGFDLPNLDCEKCGTLYIKDGQDIPFATFLGFNADKVPDIDLNFSDLYQASAHEYTKVLFGIDNVFRAGTIGTVADKTANGFVRGYFEDNIMRMIIEIFKSIDKDYKEVLDVVDKEKPQEIARRFIIKSEQIRKMLPEDINYNFNEYLTKIRRYSSIRNTEIERLSLGCVGVKRTTGQHPGGIVVVPEYKEVFDFTPYQYPAEDPNSEWRTTHFSYKAIEECILKLDILGHSDPTQLRLIQEMSGTNVLDVPMDDEKTMSIFSSTKALGVTNEEILSETGTLGVPEFGTDFTISMVSETKPKTFAELVKISGLSHGTDVWLGNAQELIKKGIVPFKDVIGCRDDIMVYLMYKGLPPLDAFKIMEFVRKGRPSKEPALWQEFADKMKKYKIEDWFIDSCQKIKYMFPKAHASAYVTSAFRLAWYKVHMPVYFYASWFSSKAVDVDVETMIKGYKAIRERVENLVMMGKTASNKELNQLESLRVALEASARGMVFLPVSLKESDSKRWIVKDDKSIIPPFSSIEGLGLTVANAIVSEREERSFTSIKNLQSRAKISQTVIDKMRNMNIFYNLDEDDQLSLF